MKTLLVLAALLQAPAQEDPAIARHLAALGAESIAARDEAEEALAAIGRPAVAAIRRALASADGDEKARLERVLKLLTEPRWKTDLDAALAAAKTESKPLLVFSTIGDLGGYV